jgi:hypothetical protein
MTEGSLCKATTIIKLGKDYCKRCVARHQAFVERRTCITSPAQSPGMWGAQAALPLPLFGRLAAA